jgi:hypothetical protein
MYADDVAAIEIPASHQPGLLWQATSAITYSQAPIDGKQDRLVSRFQSL